MEVDGKWMVIAAKLYSALSSMELSHTPACNSPECGVCTQAYEACRTFRELRDREYAKLEQRLENLKT